MDKFVQNSSVLFSVIVTVYNKEQHLESCIQSILNQTYKNFEFIIVNDGSTDNSKQICDKYASKNKQIKVVHVNNRGPNAARLKGLEISYGQYIINIDGDDTIDPTLLEKCYSVYKKYPNIDIIIFDMNRNINNKTTLDKSKIDGLSGYITLNQIQKQIIPYMINDPSHRVRLHGGCVDKVIKKTLLKKHFCTNLKIRIGEDICFVYECIYYSKSIYYINEPLYTYNCNSSSITQGDTAVKEFEVFPYMKDRFKNDMRIQEQIDRDYIQTILGLLYLKANKNTILQYLNINRLNPPLATNSKMKPIEKYTVHCLYKNKTGIFTRKSLLTIYCRLKCWLRKKIKAK